MCQFTISFAGDAESLIIRSKQQIEKAGGTLTGDNSQGSFQVSTPIGSIQGSYRILEQEISMSISQKPFLLSCSRIQSELEKVMQ